MEGIQTALLFHWKLEIDHNDKGDASKAARYNIGRDRAMLIQRLAQPFAIKVNQDGEQHCAYLVELEEGDNPMGMPESTKFEYLCGKRSLENKYEVFAYIWFDSIEDAKDYAARHGMRILGGW